MALLLVSALFFGRIAARAGLPAVVGELLVESSSALPCSSA
ncbi:hypothetical protein ACFQ3Z_42385 [Streptomyces nogalater]